MQGRHGHSENGNAGSKAHAEDTGPDGGRGDALVEASPGATVSGPARVVDGDTLKILMRVI